MIDGPAEVRRILNKRLTECVTQGAHYPFKPQPMRYDHTLRLFAPQPPLPSNCARCGIGGPYHFSFDNAGRPIAAEVVDVG